MASVNMLSPLSALCPSLLSPWMSSAQPRVSEALEQTSPPTLLGSCELSQVLSVGLGLLECCTHSCGWGLVISGPFFF